MTSIPWLKLSASLWVLCLQCWCQDVGYRGLKCLNMSPGIFEGLLVNQSPFVLKASAIVGDNGDDFYLVSIVSPPEKLFSGFMLQALAADHKEMILDGYFACQPNTRRQSCGQHKNNTLTHVKKEKIHKLITVWTPPMDFEGKVLFRAYVTAETSPYWMVLETTPAVSYTQHDIFPEDQVSSRAIVDNMEEARQDCGVKRSCFGLPAGCQRKAGSCQVLVSFAPTKDGVDFQLTGQTSEKVSWLAVGLSDDKKMGDDSVTDCILRDEGKVIVQQSWNYRSPKRNQVLSDPHEGIQNMRGKFENGTLTCSWKRQFKSEIHDVDFDLINAKWHLLLARGPLKHGDKKKHHGALASNKSYNLTSVQQKAHGIDDNSVSRPDFLQKQIIVDNYKAHYLTFQEKVEHAAEDLLKSN